MRLYHRCFARFANQLAGSRCETDGGTERLPRFIRNRCMVIDSMVRIERGCFHFDVSLIKSSIDIQVLSGACLPAAV